MNETWLLPSRCDQRQLFALTSPLLTTASGAKMGKKKHVLVKRA